MKKTTALILLLTLILSSFSSCLSDTYPPPFTEIKSTSSDAEGYAKWLGNRLENTGVRVTLGIGNSDKYGIDMSSFEDDGYIIKTVGEETVIFGKTEDGLDRGCRRYANDTELYGISGDTVYHEGYRIDELRLFGQPIDEYTVLIPSDRGNAAFAAEEFTRLAELTCGKAPGLSKDNTTNGRTIRFVLANDSNAKDKYYRYYEDGGDLVFLYSDVSLASSAVYGFFEDMCGWYGLQYGDGYLAEHELIDIPVDTDKTVTQLFDYLYFGDGESDTVNDTDQTVCFLNEEYYEECLTNVMATVSGSTDTVGISLGENYCQCEACSSVLAEEGSSAATAVRFANRLSDDLSHSYPNMTIRVFADRKTDTATITVPRENVTISLGDSTLCVTHPLCGNACSNDANTAFVNRVKGWLETTDNVHVKLYKNSSSLIQSYTVDTTLDNLIFLQNLGVSGVHIQTDEYKLGTESVERRLAYLFHCSVDTASEVFDDALCGILENEYGDGWALIREYLSILRKASNSSPCRSYNETLEFDYGYYAERYGDCVSLIESAVRLAASEKQQRNCELLSCHLYYMGCLSSYFDAFYSENKDTLTILDKQYSLMFDRLEKNEISTEHIAGVAPSPVNELYYEAWREWAELREVLFNGEFTDDESIIALSERLNEKADEDSLSLLFRTDTHYSSTKSNEAKKAAIAKLEKCNAITRYSDIDLFIHGGDLINGKEENRYIAEESISEYVSMMRGLHQSTPTFFLRGNHDDNSWYGYDSLGKKMYNSFPVDTIVTTERWRELIGDDKYGKFVMDDTGAYGYYDHEESKIRVLFLDTSDIPYYEDEVGTYKYGAYAGHGIRQKQLQFMADAMMFSDKGDEASEWAILVTAHVPVETMKDANSKYRFGGLEAAGRNFYAFLRLLKAYQRGVDFNENCASPTNYGDGGYYVKGKTWNDTPGDFAYNVHAEFSNNGAGEVIAIISGHTHIDNFSDDVGKSSYNNNSFIYPELSYGYPYFCVSTGSLSVFTVERNGDGTGIIYVDHYGTSILPYGQAIAEDDDAVYTIDPVAQNVITSSPDRGTVASGEYAVLYSQNR